MKTAHIERSPADEPDELAVLMDQARKREVSGDPSIMPLVRLLYDGTWRGIVEQGDEPGAVPMDRLRFDLARAMFTDLRSPPLYDHAEDPQIVEQLYLAIETRMLTEYHGTDQAGMGSVVSALRRAVMEGPAGPDGVMPRQVRFNACGVGYREVALVASFPEAGPTAHLGQVQIAFANDPTRVLGQVSAADMTGYRRSVCDVEVLGRLHRFGRYGERMVPFGNWFTADGAGRELAAAIIDGYVSRVWPDVENGMGGTSPQFGLTEAGVRAVLANPALPRMFDHIPSEAGSIATLVDGDQRVPFAIDTGAILAVLGDDPRFVPAYVTKSNLVGLEAGQEYKRQDLGYVLVHDLPAWREKQVKMEEMIETAPPLWELNEDEFDATFGYVTKPDGGTVYEREELSDIDPNRIWSVIYTDDDEDGNTYLIPGIHHVNCSGYTVSEKPWPHEHIQAIYMSGDEDDDELDNEGPRP